MTTLTMRGQYFDGAVSRGQAAELRYADGALTLLTDVLALDIDIDRTHVEPQIARAPRRVYWSGGGAFTSEDHAELDALTQALPARSGQAWIHWLEARWAMAAVSLVVFVVVVAGGMIWGVPYMAQRIAHAAPAAVSAQLASSNLAVIDQILEPSALDPSRRLELEVYFRRHGNVPNILFRGGGGIGPNAFALSADAVVFTDELVELAADDEELLAVFFHELGHAELKHVEISILQSSAWVVASTVLLGDLSGASELIVSLPIVVGEAAFTRDMEREADDFAVERLLAANVAPEKLADMLERLETFTYEVQDDALYDQADVDETAVDVTMVDAPSEAAEEPGVAVSEEDYIDAESDYDWAVSLLDYLATHPATEERAAAIRARAAESH